MLLVSMLAGCGPATSSYSYANEPDPRKIEYQIGPSDQVGVSVWGVPELNTTARVRPDGAVTVPLVGDVRAAGRTPTELRDAIQTRLKAFVKDESAVVSVVLLAVGSYRVLVLGRVGSPGIIQSEHFLTVNEAVTMAGGPTPFAKPKRLVLVRRRPDGTVVSIPIRYDLIMAGANTAQNLVLQRDDQLYMP